MPSLGKAAQFLIALVALYGAVEAHRARTQSAHNGAVIDQVKRVTNGMRTELEKAAEARGNLEGRAELHAEELASHEDNRR